MAKAPLVVRGDNVYKMVFCAECGRPLLRLTAAHVWQVHQMTMKEYRDKYPTARLAKRKARYLEKSFANYPTKDTKN